MRPGIVTALYLVLATADLFVLAHPTRADQARLAFVMNGKLMTQAASGGKISPANEKDKVLWRTTTAKKTSFISSDGRYEAFEIDYNSIESHYPTYYSQLGGSVKQIVVIRPKGEKRDVFPPNSLDKLFEMGSAGGAEVTFQGWVPRTHIFVLAMRTGIAGALWNTRVGYDLDKKQIVPFNGWLSPLGTYAIVPNKEGSAKLESNRTDAVKFGDRVWDHSPITYYSVRLPRGAQNYRVATAQKVLLRSGNTPAYFRLADPLYFSPDEKFAITGRYFDYKVIDMTTGKVRKLPANANEVVLLRGVER